MHQSEADNTGSQSVPSLLDDTQAVVADSQPAQPLEPTDGPLHHPTNLPQPTPMLPPSPTNVRLDTQPGQQPAGRVAVVAPIGVQPVGHLLGTASLATDGGKLQHQRDDLPVVAGVGSGGADSQRYAVAVHQERMFAAFFAAGDRA